MAKKPTKTATKDLLTAIVSATAAGSFMYVSKTDAQPLLDHQPPLIEVNMSMLDPNDNSKAAARATDAAQSYLNASSSTNKSEVSTVSTFEILSGVELPVSKRGGGRGGAPVRYPFAQLEIGQTFFVPVSDKLPNPVKTLGSTVSSANMKYAEKTGETKTVKRAQKGPDGKPVKNGLGEKVMEDVQAPVYKYSRKFVIRGVEKGKTYGTFTAPENGALISRVAV